MIPKLPEKKFTNEEKRNKAERTNHIRRKLEEWLNELLCRNDVAADEALCSFLGILPEDAVAGGLVGWMVGWMDGWLVGWLVGWLIVQSYAVGSTSLMQCGPFP